MTGATEGVRAAASPEFLKRLGGFAKVGGGVLGGGLAALPILAAGYDDYTKADEPFIDNLAAGTTALGTGAAGAGLGALIGGGLGSLILPGAGTAIGASLGAGLAGGPAADLGGNIGRGANDMMRSMGILPKEKTEFTKELDRLDEITDRQLGARRRAIPVTEEEQRMMNRIGAEGMRDMRNNQQMLNAQVALLNAASATAQTWDPSGFASALMNGGMG